MVTPFQADGQIDFEGLKNLIEHLIDGGVQYLVSLGTTGESATLNASERKQVWEFTAKVVNKRVTLVAGIGGNNTQISSPNKVLAHANHLRVKSDALSLLNDSCIKPVPA